MLRRFRPALMAAAIAVLVMVGSRPTAAQADGFGSRAAVEARPAPAGTMVPSSGAQPAEAAPATYPVAARDLERGEVLTAEDIAYVALPEGEAAPAEAPASLVGWTTRRVIAAGDALREPAVSPPELVRAGEPVQAVYKGRTIVLRVAGTAAGSGAMGDRVLVRVDARRRLQGVVIGPSLVLLESSESR